MCNIYAAILGIHLTNGPKYSNIMTTLYVCQSSIRHETESFLTEKKLLTFTAQYPSSSVPIAADVDKDKPSVNVV